VRKWLRLIFLVDTLQNKNLRGKFDKAILKSYKHVWDPIPLVVTTLRSEETTKLLSVKKAEKLEEVDKKRREITIGKIDGCLQQIHALIAASVAGKARNQNAIAEALESLGLSVGPLSPIDNRIAQNAILASLIFIFVAVLLVKFIVDQDPLTAFQWATGALALHGSAAVAAWKTRAGRLSQGTEEKTPWLPMHVRRRIVPTGQYLLLMLKGTVAAAFGLFVWWVLFAAITQGLSGLDILNQIWIPSYAVIGSLSAFRVAYSLDIAQRNEERAGIGRKVLQVTMQAVTTGFAGYFITVSLAARYEEITTTFAIEAAVISALGGSILGIITMILIKYEDEYVPPVIASDHIRKVDTKAA
jgi:hypothetical protein